MPTPKIFKKNKAVANSQIVKDLQRELDIVDALLQPVAAFTEVKKIYAAKQTKKATDISILEEDEINKRRELLSEEETQWNRNLDFEQESRRTATEKTKERIKEIFAAKGRLDNLKREIENITQPTTPAGSTTTSSSTSTGSTTKLQDILEEYNSLQQLLEECKNPAIAQEIAKEEKRRSEAISKAVNDAATQYVEDLKGGMEEQKKSLQSLQEELQSRLARKKAIESRVSSIAKTIKRLETEQQKNKTTPKSTTSSAEPRQLRKPTEERSLDSNIILLGQEQQRLADIEASIADIKQQIEEQQETTNKSKTAHNTARAAQKRVVQEVVAELKAGTTPEARELAQGLLQGQDLRRDLRDLVNRKFYEAQYNVEQKRNETKRNHAKTFKTVKETLEEHSGTITKVVATAASANYGAVASGVASVFSYATAAGLAPPVAAVALTTAILVVAVAGKKAFKIVDNIANDTLKAFATEDNLALESSAPIIPRQSRAKGATAKTLGLMAVAGVSRTAVDMLLKSAAGYITLADSGITSVAAKNIASALVGVMLVKGVPQVFSKIIEGVKNFTPPAITKGKVAAAVGGLTTLGIATAVIKHISTLAPAVVITRAAIEAAATSFANTLPSYVPDIVNTCAAMAGGPVTVILATMALSSLLGKAGLDKGMFKKGINAVASAGGAIAGVAYGAGRLGFTSPTTTMLLASAIAGVGLPKIKAMFNQATKFITSSNKAATRVTTQVNQANSAANAALGSNANKSFVRSLVGSAASLVATCGMTPAKGIMNFILNHPIILGLSGAAGGAMVGVRSGLTPDTLKRIAPEQLKELCKGVAALIAKYTPGGDMTDKIALGLAATVVSAVVLLIAEKVPLPNIGKAFNSCLSPFKFLLMKHKRKTASLAVVAGVIFAIYNNPTAQELGALVKQILPGLPGLAMASGGIGGFILATAAVAIFYKVFSQTSAVTPKELFGKTGGGVSFVKLAQFLAGMIPTASPIGIIEKTIGTGAIPIIMGAAFGIGSLVIKKMWDNYHSAPQQTAAAQPVQVPPQVQPAPPLVQQVPQTPQAPQQHAAAAQPAPQPPVQPGQPPAPPPAGAQPAPPQQAAAPWGAPQVGQPHGAAATLIPQGQQPPQTSIPWITRIQPEHTGTPSKLEITEDEVGNFMFEQGVDDLVKREQNTQLDEALKSKLSQYSLGVYDGLNDQGKKAFKILARQILQQQQGRGGGSPAF